jgi:transposase
MVRSKHNKPKKKKRPKVSVHKMKALRRQLEQIGQSKEDLSRQTPFHLLVVASYLNRLNFKEIFNSSLQWDETQWKFSPGALAQLMIIATFIPANKKIALSRIPQAYLGMDLELLVGEPVEPGELSDDLFAAMLDRFHKAGCDRILSTIALSARATFDLPPNCILHSDTTSHILYGDYSESEHASEPFSVLPTYGYSKDKRNDLKQIMTGMVTDGDGLVLASKVLDGNTADCQYNLSMMKTLQEVFGKEFYKYTYIADSKLLTQKNIELIYRNAKPVNIISRLPENFAGKIAKNVRTLAYERQEWQTLGICCEHPAGKGKEPEYWAQTFQRDVFGFGFWFHIFKSSDGERRLQAKLKEDREAFESDLKALTDNGRACEPDAIADLNAFIMDHSKSFFSVNLSVVKSVSEKNPVGRPSSTPKPKRVEVTWRISAGELIQNDAMVERQRQKDESFCILTNNDPETMSSRDVLLLYKGQRKVEHNFSVLKMPLLASTIFLEKPERIEAMMTLLYFSVLLHGILQVISRKRIEACEEPLRLGPENRPLVRPMSETMISILILFEIITKGNDISIRCKMPERRKQFDLIMYLIDFDPTAI